MKFKTITVLIIIMLMNSCKNRELNSNLTVASDSTSLEIKTDTSYFQLSPDEIINELLSENKELNPKFVNPISNAKNYIDTKYQALNLGVFIIDFVYLNICNDNQNALKYLKEMQSLAQMLNIYDCFNESLFTRIKNNILNHDTLSQITNEVYFKMFDILENTNRQNIFALLSTGAFIEAIYLSSMNISDDIRYKSSIQKILEQKYVFTNLTKDILKNSDDPVVKSVVISLDSLGILFAGTSNTEVRVKHDKPNHIIINGGEIIVTHENFFLRFKRTIIKSRMDIISGK